MSTFFSFCFALVLLCVQLHTPLGKLSMAFWQISLLESCITRLSGSLPAALPHITVIHRWALLDPYRK